MIPLVLVTLIWAFSFPLIGTYLRGVDPLLVAVIRLALASLCFLPFHRPGQISRQNRLELLAIGAAQFGVMYIAYLSAFRFLETHLVALFSVFTPLWVTAAAALRQRKGLAKAFLAAAAAVSGALMIRGVALPERDFLTGFLLMQISNLAFGGGQVWFRDWKRRNPDLRERNVFFFPLLGGFLLSLTAMVVQAAFGSTLKMPAPAEWAVLVYLGAIASAVGFFLWNYGASRVTTGFLAAANNLVIPVAMAVTFFLFGERPDSPPEFAAGSALILIALVIGGRKEKR